MLSENRVLMSDFKKILDNKYEKRKSWQFSGVRIPKKIWQLLQKLSFEERIHNEQNTTKISQNDFLILGLKLLFYLLKDENKHTFEKIMKDININE